MHHRRTHKKSKSGCQVCRERKIKCDEKKPRCANCIHFEVLCSFDPAAPNIRATSSSPAGSAAVSVSTKKRGRGRPRKDWTSGVGRSATQPTEQPVRPIESSPASPFISDNITTHSPSNSSTASPVHLGAPVTCCSLNVVDFELLLHFTTRTSHSLAHPEPNNPIALFWSLNVPQIGLSCHAVLHLLLALAAHHLTYINAPDTERSIRYTFLARTHSSLGLAQLTKSLATIDESNCGALYTAATLFSFCTLASGPTDPDDLLVCNVGPQEATPQASKSVVQGVRLIRETFEPAVLFSGHVAPLGAPSNPGDEKGGAKTRCVEEGFPRLDWARPLHRVRDLIISQQDDPNTAIYLDAYQQIELIYEATYGKPDGSFTCPAVNKFVFIWGLYRIDDRFVQCLQQRRPLSLLLLAYYAFLFTTLQREWYIKSWPQHILTRIRELIGGEYMQWLCWPLQQAGLSTVVERRPGWLRHIMS